MTREDIEAMEPGRELDRLIRIHIFGDIDESWVWKEWWGEHWITDNKEVATWFELPKYSTDISAAWEVVGKMKETHHFILSRDTVTGKQVALFEKPKKDCPYDVYDYESDSMPEAICKAALLAVLEG